MDLLWASSLIEKWIFLNEELIIWNLVTLALAVGAEKKTKFPF